MGRLSTRGEKQDSNKKHRPVTLSTVAERVGLTKGICSAVLNGTPASRSVPQHTRDRILAAARELSYRPSFYARHLGVKRTYMIGVVTQEVGDFYSSPIISGIERCLRENNFFFLTVAHRHDRKLFETDYKEGTLVVDLYDAKTKQLIWRGSAEDTLSNKAEKNGFCAHFVSIPVLTAIRIRRWCWQMCSSRSPVKLQMCHRSRRILPIAVRSFTSLSTLSR